MVGTRLRSVACRTLSSKLQEPSAAERFEWEALFVIIAVVVIAHLGVGVGEHLTLRDGTKHPSFIGVRVDG